MLWSLCIAFSASGSGVSMPQKIVDEIRLAHLLENLRPLGDVERRLAGQTQDVTGLLLPLDQMRQQIERRLAVADEIVIDEIHRAGDAAFEQFVEFGGDLLRRFETRIATVQPRDVAEFALVGAPAGVLDAAEKIAPDLGKLIGRESETRSCRAGRRSSAPPAARDATDRGQSARSAHWSHRPFRRREGSRTTDSNPDRR